MYSEKLTRSVWLCLSYIWKVLVRSTIMSASSPNPVLYKWDHSTPCNAVRILGSIMGLQFEFKEPGLLTREHQTPKFRKMNPMSSIPVLEDGDLIVSESHAIILYLVEKYGGEHKAKLYPSDPQTRALVHQMLFCDAFLIFPRVKNVAKPMILGEKTGPTEEDLALIAEVYPIIEAFLESRLYVAADHLTVADLSLGTSVKALMSMYPCDPERFPKTQAWVGRLMEITQFKEHCQAGSVAFRELIKNAMQAAKKSE